LIAAGMRRFERRRRRSARAFTVLQLLLVIAIIAVLATLSVQAFSRLRARAERVQCTANLRSLFVAAESYLQEHNSWPQILMSPNSEDPSQDYATGWIASLKPYGPSQKTWLCPTVQRKLGDPDYLQLENVRTDYVASAFDDKPASPHQWPKQPWFAEIDDAHGNGQLMILSDGSVSDTKSIGGIAAAAP
jgi:type II secretory pathway pseudopilin PulG